MKKNKILLVEDNEGDIVLTSEAFEECSCKANIQVARNGKEAINTGYMLYDLIDSMLDKTLKILNRFGKDLRNLETNLFRDVGEETISEINVENNLDIEMFFNNAEKKVQDKVNAKKVKARPVSNEKDW